MLLAVFLVAGDVGRHHRNRVLLQIKTVVVQHRLLLIHVGREQHALLPKVPDQCDGVGVRCASVVRKRADAEVHIQAIGYLGVDVRAQVVL